MTRILLAILALSLATPAARADRPGKKRPAPAGAAVTTTAAPRPARPARTKGTRDPGVNRRQANQASRVARGVKYGSLTAREAAGLAAREKTLAESERRFKADGELTAAERAELHRSLDDLSRDIFVDKHDAEVVGPDTPANVRVRNRLGTGRLTGADARAALGKARRLVALRLQLGGQLADEDRARAQGEHDRLVDDLYAPAE